MLSGIFVSNTFRRPGTATLTWSRFSCSEEQTCMRRVPSNKEPVCTWLQLVDICSWHSSCWSTARPHSCSNQIAREEILSRLLGPETARIYSNSSRYLNMILVVFPKQQQPVVHTTGNYQRPRQRQANCSRPAYCIQQRGPGSVHPGHVQHVEPAGTLSGSNS